MIGEAAEFVVGTTIKCAPYIAVVAMIYKTYRCVKYGEKKGTIRMVAASTCVLAVYIHFGLM